MILLALGSVVQVLGGYLLILVVARVLGVEHFGDYYVVASVMTVMNLVCTRGVAVEGARRIAAEPAAAGAHMGSLGRSLARESLGLAAVTIAGAPLIAGAMGAPSLALDIRIAGFGAFTFALLAWFQAAASGLDEVVPNAWSVAAYGAGRCALVVSGAMVAGLPGAIVGFVASPLLAALPLAGPWRRARARSAERRDPRRITLRQSGWPLVIALCTMLLLTVDVFIAKRLVDAALVGAYSAASTIGHVPWFLLAASGLAVVPAIARARTGPEQEDAISAVLLDAVVVLALPAALLVAGGDEVLAAAFEPEFVGAAATITPLTLLTVAASLLSLTLTVDVARERGRRAAIMGGASAVAMGTAFAVGTATGDLVVGAWAAAASVAGAFLLDLVLVLGAGIRRLPVVRIALTAVLGALCAAPAAFVDGVPHVMLAAVPGAAVYVLVVSRGVWRSTATSPLAGSASEGAKVRADPTT